MMSESNDAYAVYPPVVVNTAARDQYIAARDIRIIHLRSTQLVPRPVAEADFLSSDRFAPPRIYDVALSHLRGLGIGRSGHPVVVLVGQEDSGRRTTALRLLADVAGADQPIRELRPDWEEPSADLLPDEGPACYLLDLSGTGNRLPGSFRRGLAGYAAEARSRDIRMVVIASENVWGSIDESSQEHAFAVLRYTGPDPVEITSRRLLSAPHTAGREEWLRQDGSVFRGLLTADSAPEDAVRLAKLIEIAENAGDKTIADGFLGWRDKVSEWFDGDGEEIEQRRVLQITAVFFDGAPLRTVMDARDLLLTNPQLRLGTQRRGPLSGPSAATLCANAGLKVNDNGCVTLDESRPGIGIAVLRHVWGTRPQMRKIIADWLTAVTGPGGPAVNWLGSVADVLAALASTEGVEIAVTQADQWLGSGKPAHAQLAVSLVDGLSIDPRFAGRMRTVLANWAQAGTYPNRQKAVARICAGRFGRERPHLALTRLRYVLDNTLDAEVCAEAVGAIRTLADLPDLSALVVDTLTEWARSTAADRTGSRQALVDILTIPTDGQSEAIAAQAAAFVHRLLTSDGQAGVELRTLLAGSLQTLAGNSHTAAGAQSIMEGLIQAAEKGVLPEDEVIAVISGSIEVGFLEGAKELRSLTYPSSLIRKRLLDNAVAALRGALDPAPQNVNAEDGTA